MCRSIRSLIVSLSRQGSRVGLAGIVLAAMGGCALPAHNNTLIFAVKRDLGVGVTTPSATDAGVSVTIGYKERQAAWVPMWANESSGDSGQGVKTINCDQEKFSCKNGPKYLADGLGVKGSDSHDAYSTYASFGGDVSAGGDGSGRNAQAGTKLASFFATGIAAQLLAAQPNVVGDVYGKPGPESGAAAKSPDPTKKQAESVGEFLERTVDREKKGEVRASCVALLAKDAALASSDVTVLEALPKTSPKVWVEGLLANSDLKKDIPHLARHATKHSAKFDEQTETKGRVEVAKAYCG